MLKYDRANGQFGNSMSSFKQWSLQPASKPPRSAGWLWLDLCSVQWEPGREALIKSNSLCSRQAPNPSFPGMKLSMKNNVHSSNKISDPHLTPDLESRGLSVLSAVRRHRRPHAVLPMSNWLTEKALKPTATHGTCFCGRRRASHLHFQLLFKLLPHKARKSEGKETMFPAHNHSI